MRSNKVGTGKSYEGNRGVRAKRPPAGIVIVSLILLGFAVYGNSLSGTFVWDDEFLVRDNVYVKSWSNVPNVFTKDIGAGAGSRFNFYRPLQMLTYMADYSLWRLDVRGYHLTNIVLHILVAVCTWWLVNLLFGDALLSFLTATLFLVHPIHTEAVSYVSGRADSLAALFMLLTLIFYIKNQRREDGGAYALMVCSYCLALLSRENSLILPVLLLLYHYAFQEKVRMKNIAPVIGIALAYIVLRLTVLGSLLRTVSCATTLSQRVPGLFVAITNYARLIVFPFNLHMEYGNRLFPLSDPRAIAGALLLIVLAAYGWRKKETDRAVFFSISWFLLALIPVSNLYPINAYMAEHWLYLPSIGFFLILAKGLARAYRTQPWRILALGLIAGLVIFYSLLTIMQNDYWKEPIAFYKRTLKYAPDVPKPYYNLGNVYKDMGNKEEAIGCYKKAIEIDPNYSQAYTNLGIVYNSLGRKEEAADLYKKAIGINPLGSAYAYNNLGIVYHDMGRPDEALAAYKKAIELNPDYAHAYNNLGVVYDEAGRKDEAIASYKKAVEINPRDAYAYNNLGTIYHDMGRDDEAVAAFKKAIEVDSDLRYAHYTYTNLGATYNDLGRHEEAIALLKEAIEISPRYAQAYGNLALAYFRARRYQLAIEYCDKAKALGLVDQRLSEALKPYREK